MPRRSIGLGLVAALSLVAFSPSAKALILTGDLLGSGTWELDCPAGCQLLAGPTDPVDLVPNQNPEGELNYFNNNVLVNGTFTLADYVKVDLTDDQSDQSSEPGGFSFDISRPYFWLKIDQSNGGYLWFANLDGLQNVTYEGSGQASGLSHYSQVPVPAAALLFFTALGGLFAWRRRSVSGCPMAAKAA